MSYPFFAAKIKHQQRLREAARFYRDFSYSILITGPFLDWGLSVVPFIVNIGTRSAEGESTSDPIPLNSGVIVNYESACTADKHWS